MFETAFLLAVDLGHHDLFMDLHYIAIKIGETEMAAAARAQASALLSRCSSEASECSRSSCSQCSETGSSSCSSDELPIQNVYDENCLTTNFNNVTPKTYLPNSANTPSVPKLFPSPRINYVKPPIVPQLPVNKTPTSTSNLLAPPLPFAPITTLGIPYEDTKFNPIRTFSVPSLPQMNLNAPTFAPVKMNTSRPLVNRFSSNYRDDLFMFSAHSASNSNINTIKYTPIRNVVPPPLPSVSSVPSVLPTTSNTKKQQAKVKFSDTVTAFIVPEVKRPIRPTPPAHITDPQKELADSLPLCSPNEDYLKDFAPVRKNEQSEDAQPQPKIKVVHFGVV